MNQEFNRRSEENVMAIIFNSKENNITEEQMKILYRNNLIECDDFTFTVAIIPDWAIEEAKELIKRDFKGTVWKEFLISGSKKAVELKNKSVYPKLYEKTMK